MGHLGDLTARAVRTRWKLWLRLQLTTGAAPSGLGDFSSTRSISSREASPYQDTNKLELSGAEATLPKGAPGEGMAAGVPPNTHRRKPRPRPAARPSLQARQAGRGGGGAPRTRGRSAATRESGRAGGLRVEGPRPPARPPEPKPGPSARPAGAGPGPGGRGGRVAAGGGVAGREGSRRR